MSPFDVDIVSHLPDKPGVYLMKNKLGKVIYVGKAKDLRKRIQQYINLHDKRVLIPHLLKELSSIDTIIVSTEKEALVVENTLIKQYKPKYNLVLKDDKSFAYLFLDQTHPFPKLECVRFKGAQKKRGIYFGPYTNAAAARQTYDLLAKTFPLRECSDQEFSKRKRPCILHAMKRCIAPCVSLCSSEEYLSYVEKLIAFLRGKDDEVLNTLEQEMEKASEALEFEKAHLYHKTRKEITELFHQRKQGLLPEHHFDALGIVFGKWICITVIQVRFGHIVGKIDYSFEETLEEQASLLGSFLLQYYCQHEQEGSNDPPKEILLPFLPNEHDVIETLISQACGHKVPCHCPTKGAKKNLLDLAQTNGQELFYQMNRKHEQKGAILTKLMELVSLPKYPNTIECIDVSHFSGSNPVSAIITYKEGEYYPKGVWYFHLKHTKGADDYGAIEETLSRRIDRALDRGDLPDLFIIDGGKGHLNVAYSVLEKKGCISIPIIALAKEEHKHTKGLTKEQLFTLTHTDPILLPTHSDLLLFLQTIRDKTHQKVLALQKKQRSKEISQSKLDQIPSIGKVKKQRLLTHFKSIEQIKQASDAEILSIEGISEKELKNIRKYLH